MPLPIGTSTPLQSDTDYLLASPTHIAPPHTSSPSSVTSDPISDIDELPSKHLLVHREHQHPVWRLFRIARRACAAFGITCYIFWTVLGVLSFALFTASVGYYAYRTAFYVPVGFCYGGDTNTPFKWLPDTSCPFFDDMPQEKWQPYWRTNESVSLVHVPTLTPKSILAADPSKLELDSEKTLATWFYNGSHAEMPFNGRAVVVVHGIRACKESYNALLPSAMLHKHGFHVINIDLRNHGGSFRDNWGTVTFGSLEHVDVLSAIHWLKTHTNLNSDAIGVLGVSMGASTSLIAWGRDRSIPALWADSPPCDVAKTIEYNAEGAFLFFSGSYTLWTMCQAAPLWDNYGCMPWPYDPLATSRLNLTVGAVNDKGDPIGEKQAFSRRVHFEHTQRDFIVPLANSVQCMGEVNRTADLVSTYVGFDNSSVPPKHAKGKWVPCDHHVKTMLVDSDDYELRLTSFFSVNLRTT